MASKYRMQIVNSETGTVVAEFMPGLSVEINFVDDCVNRAIAKGVGIGRTAKHVAADIRAAIEEAIYELKVQVRP